MSTHQQILDACTTLRSVWNTRGWAQKIGPLTQSGELIMLGIAKGETDFGNAPGFGGSNNWGALVCYRHDYGCLQHGDHDANGHPITANFQKYPSQEEGVEGFLSTLLGKKNVPPVLDGSAEDVARVMYANGYYTGVHGTGNPDANIADYTHMISSQAAQIASVLGGSFLGSVSTVTAKAAAVTALLLFMAGAIGYAALKGGSL